MRDGYDGYFQRTKDELDVLWRDAIIVVDTNVLLDLFRLSTETRDQLFEVLEALGDRLFLPAQVVEEFHRHRVEVQLTNVNAARSLQKELAKTVASMEKANPERNPWLPADELASALASVRSLIEQTDRKLGELTDLPHTDPALDRLVTLCAGKVSKPYDLDRLEEIEREGARRYERKIPPGYEDEKKPNPYGDLILWHQTIDHAREHQVPVLLITRDTKEDWWWRVDGRTIGPRPELVNEFRAKTGQSFHTYTPDRFLDLRSELDNAQRQAAVAEIVQVSAAEASSEVYREALDEMHELSLIRGLATSWLQRTGIAGNVETLSDAEVLELVARIRAAQQNNGTIWRQVASRLTRESPFNSPPDIV